MARSQSIEAVLRKVLSALKKKKGKCGEEEIRKAWASVVGKKASQHTRPVALKRAQLIVNVDGSGWLYELTIKKKDIVKRLGEKLKTKRIKEIRLRIGEINPKDKEK